MRASWGSHLKPVKVEPGTEGENQPPVPDLNQGDTIQVNSAEDDLLDLPAAPKAMEISPNKPASSKENDDFDLDSLPYARGSLGQVFDSVSTKDPDHVAKVLDASQKTGQDPAFVETHIKEAHRAVNAPDDNFFRSVEEKFPGTTKFLKVPQNMAIAHDDIPNVAKHEQLVQGITKAMDVASSLKSGWQGSVLGMESRRGLPDTELPPDAPIWNRLAAQAAGLAGDFPAMVAGGAAGAEAGATTGAIAGTPLGIPGAMVGSAIGGIFGAGAGAFGASAAIKEHLRQQFEKGDIHGVSDALERAGNDLSAATKQGLVGGLTSVVGAGVALPFESAAAKALLPSIFDNKVLKTLAPLAAEDVTMTKAGNVIEGKETKPQDYLDTALVIGFMHGATHLGQVAAEHYVEAKKTAQAVQFYDGLGETGAVSKLRERLPTQYQAMLGGLTNGSPVENIHIPQEAFDQYFQSKNIDPEQAANELGVADSYTEAKNTGGSVEIPTADFVQKIVKTEHYQGLRDDIKFDPEGFTVNEIKQSQKEIQEQIKQEDQKAQEGEGKLTPEESAQKIYDERYQQLVEAGGTPQEAKMGATLQARAFKTLAERTGQDPYELAKRFELEIRKREQAASTGGRSFGQTPVDYDNLADETFNAPDALQKYLSMEETNGGRDIDPDLVRSLFEPYAKDREGKILHLDRTTKPSADLAQKIYEQQLKSDNMAPVVLMAGGSASGKTTYRRSYSPEIEGLPSVYDTNSANYEGTKARIHQALDSGRQVIMNLAFKPFEEAVKGNSERFKSTGRLVHPHYMAFTHVNAIETFLRLAKEFEGDKRVSFAAFQPDETGKPVWFKNAVEELNKLRYTSEGKSANVAIKELERVARERLKDELAEVRKTKAADSGRSAQANDERTLSRADLRGAKETGGNRSFDQSALPAVRSESKNNLSPLGFYSQLESEVSKMDFKQIPAKDLASRIKNIQGIKGEELEHTGILEWLNGHEGKVSKEEVQEYLKNNGVKVEQVVKAENMGDSSGAADWSEQERDTPDQSDYDNEYEYYRSEDYWDKEKNADLRNELAPDYTDENGDIDEDALNKAMEEVKDERSQENAEEYVDSDDYSGARFTVTERNTRETLHGSDELGWYHSDLGEISGDLEEAKVKLLSHLINKGAIEGNVADHIHPEDIKWKRPNGERPSEATLKKKAKALFEKEKDRFIEQAKDTNSFYLDESGKLKDHYTKKEYDKEVNNDAKIYARDEVEESYDKPDNPKNKVTVSLDHGVLNGRIIGNDVKGYKFELDGKDIGNERVRRGSARTAPQEFPLEAKSLAEAKLEVNKVLLENKKITPKHEPTPENINTPTSGTKWSKYKVPGGENYREVLLTLPHKNGDDFSYTTHFDEKNILAHVRLTDRTDAEGRKTLFIEEMQSDWHQQGRERGYKEKDVAQKITDLVEQKDVLPDDMNFSSYMEKYHPEVSRDDIAREFKERESANFNEWEKYNEDVNAKHKAIDDQIKELKSAVPNAPFKNTEAWAGLALKRMIRMAVEQGYEALSWTPADVHVERWGTDNVSWKKIADGEYRVGSVEQRGGRADGVDIEELARRRGELLERKGSVVKTKEELKEVLLETLNRERNDRSIDSLTDNIWKQMQEKEEGEKNPRAEGMQFFYDKMVPDVAKKILKKLDPEAKIEVGEIKTSEDYTGVNRAGDAEENVSGDQIKALEIPLTEKLKEKVMEGQSLFQPNEQGSNPRGRISFLRDKAVIELFKDANRSTFLHESGHYFLEIMQHMAGEENAPQSIKDDVKAIRDWMGLKDGEQIGVQQHEQFARGFEAYLMEGKAPSEALRQAFAKFKKWLVHIYKSIKGLNVELSPDIRSVMDRLLATDEEISNAQEAQGFRQASGFEVPAEVKPRLDDLAFAAREQAESELIREQMNELSVNHKEFLNSERIRLKEEAEKQVRQEPVYQAIDYIKEQVGKKNVQNLAKKMLEGRLDDADAVHFETAAEIQGVFADGKDLALNIVNSKATDHFNKTVDAIVEQGMAPHADLMNTRKIRSRALELVHNDKLSDLLALERSILADKVKKADINQEVSKRNRAETKIQVDAAKKQAQETLNQKPIKDATNARIYVTAERNAAAKASSAITRGDFQRAQEYKRQQMLNHALAREAMRNQEVSEKAVSYLKDAANRGNDLKKMPYAFNRQVDQILERFGFKEKEPEDLGTLKQIAVDMLSKGEDPLEIANATGMIVDPQSGQWRPETLRDFLSRVNENYLGIQIPDSILNSGAIENFKDLKMIDLRDLKNSVKIISDAGQRYNRFLNDFIKVDMKEAAAKFKASVQELIGSPYAENRKIGTKFDSKWKQRIENLKNLPDSMIPSLVNTLTFCHYLDGGEQGPAHDYIYRPMKEAEDRKFARYAKMREEISGDNGLLGKFYTPKELADYKKEATKFDGRSITKENILAMALNWGNEANRDRIRDGFGSRDASGKLIPLNDRDIQNLFKHLSKKDWDFAQATWKYLDTYWPEISALEMKMRGVEPERVSPAPFVNEHGFYEGGYYPIAYDFEKSGEAYKSEQAKNELYKQYSTSSAQTESGHTQARVSFVARPVRLSLDVLFNHLENIIHDLEFRPAIVDTSKFLSMNDVKKTIEDGVGMSAKRGLDDWLKSIASDQSENLTWLEKAYTWTRFGTTISALGLTPKAFLLHMPSNVFNSMWEIGVKDTTSMMTRAALDVALGRGNLKDFVFSKSERMKQRLTVRDRDIMDMAKAWQGTAAGIIPHYAFMSLHLADEAVSIPLWAEVYKKNLAELGEKGAANLADETVTRTLGSGSKVDQIGVQRGHQAKKLLTMFYSWMSVMFNRSWLDGKMAGLEYKKENVGTAAAILAKATLFGFALPAIHEALLGEALHNGPTTDDERKKRMIGTIIHEPFSMIPVVRDIAGPIIHKTLGEHGGDFKMSPVEMAIQNVYSPLADGARLAFTDKQADEKYAEEVARGMAQAFGYPQQLNSWAFNFWDYVQDNGEASMKDFLSRRKRK